jgi:uncharacterized protein (TIGR00369 family)
MPKLSDLVEKWLAGDLELAPITKLLEVRPISLGDGEARVEMTASNRLHNAMGTLHGGGVADLADVAMGAALATIAAEGESFTTLQMQMRLLRARRQRPIERPRARHSSRPDHRASGVRSPGCRGKARGQGDVYAMRQQI